MTIKKFPQSCILVSTGKTKILIDPGVIDFDEKFLPDWKSADAVLVTHRHGDHFHAEVLGGPKPSHKRRLDKNPAFAGACDRQTLNKPIYSTAEVANSLAKNSPTKINIVKGGDKFKIGGVTIEVTRAVHGYIPIMKPNGAEILENIGFILDDGKTRLYFTGDTMCFNNDYRADILVAPITSHGVTFTAFPLALYAKEVGAKTLLVVHQEKLLCPVDLKTEEQILRDQGVNYKIPSVGEVIDLK